MKPTNTRDQSTGKLGIIPVCPGFPNEGANGSFSIPPIRPAPPPPKRQNAAAAQPTLESSQQVVKITNRSTGTDGCSAEKEFGGIAQNSAGNTCPEDVMNVPK